MFQSPWILLLLLCLPWAGWRLFARPRTSAVCFTSLGIARHLGRTLRQRLLWAPGALTLATIVVLILALARPREGREQTIVDSEGIAIEMIVDRSSSMEALDFKIDGENVNRLTAVKNVAAKFVRGDGELGGRITDLIGLVVFARYADGVTPPTLDHGFVLDSLQQTTFARTRAEAGTAIGDAVALAIEKLRALDEQQKQRVKSKVIILLTDGENTVGTLKPLEAADLAATLGIKIYAIGVGTNGQAPIPVQDRFSGRRVIRYQPVRIDEVTLKEMAARTDGKYFRATDTESLLGIYREIDQLEKTKVETQSFFDYRELAVQPYRSAAWRIPPLLAVAFGLLLTRLLLETTWLRQYGD